MLICMHFAYCLSSALVSQMVVTYRQTQNAAAMSVLLATRLCILYRWLIEHANLFVAWMFNVIYSTALVYLSTWTVVTVAPQAAGAGVAEVTAYLNGCNLPKVCVASQSC